MIRVGLVKALSKPEAQELGSDIEQWLVAQPCQLLTEDQLRDGTDADVIVALGGDGLIMRMSHSYPNTPLLGINVGNIGFLAMIERGDWERALTLLIEGKYRVQSGPTLAATLAREGDQISSGWAINDVVVRSGAGMIDIEIYIDHQFVNTYPGDGMIVSTPQGSTAYCMAAGGPVLSAGVRGFAIVPICPHSPIRTTLVVPEDALIELVVTNDHPCDLVLDGNVERALRAGDLIRIVRASEEFQLVMLEGNDFYQAFRSKFNYMIRPNAVPTLASGRHRDSEAETSAR